MLVYTREQIQKLLEIDFIRFCIVGGSGFVINLLILVGLTRFFNTPPFVAQLVGAEVGLFSNFMLHNHWTYKKHKVEKSLTTLIVQFHAVSWPAIGGSALMVWAGVSLLHESKVLSLVVSSVVGLGWNFAWSKYVIWRDVRLDQVKEIVEQESFS